MRSILLIFWLLIGLAACKKVISVDLRDAPSQIVIEGEITNVAGLPAQVRISKSVNFSAPNTYPPVSGATVRMTDSSSGLSALMGESAPGLYTTQLLVGASYHVYKLEVTVDGTTYSASSRMPRLVLLDSVTFALNTDFNNKQNINAVVNFRDPDGLGNYYQFTESLKGRLLPDIFVFEDRLSDGKYIEQPLFNDSSYLQRGDTVLLTMNCVDKNVYNYFFSLTDVTGNNNFQTATPANPNTNISNGALGYFSAHTTTRVKVEVY
ncbi:MAG TPA: DUF4249 domain-containing protein [Puia sp.]|nr:DUF4249 domain-containing protein [Puia sp.]